MNLLKKAVKRHLRRREAASGDDDTALLDTLRLVFGVRKRDVHLLRGAAQRPVAEVGELYFKLSDQALHVHVGQGQWQRVRGLAELGEVLIETTRFTSPPDLIDR